jgi:6-phosphogluconolactonase (cycloisomerase 2 family)
LGKSRFRARAAHGNVGAMLPRLPLLLLGCGLALALAAPAQAMPAGSVTVSGKRADCLGGRGAPCAVTIRGLMSPMAGAFTKDGRHFYVGSIYMGGLISMQRDPATGRLGRLSAGIPCIGYQQGCDRVSHPMPTDLELTHDERFVLAAGSRSEGLLSYARDPATGALTPSGCLVEPKENGCWYVHGSGEVDSIEIAPDDRFVFVSSVDGIGVVARDPATGALSQAPDACIAVDDYQDYQDKCRSDRSVGRPLGMDLSADGRTLYVAAEDGGLSVLGVDPATGALTPVQRISTNDDPGGYLEAAVAPDGRHVYAITEGWEVHAFTRDAATGRLTRIPGKRGCLGMDKGCAWIEGVIDPEDIRIPEDGRHVYLAGAGGVNVLARDADGGLRQLKGRAGCEMVRGGEIKPVIGKRVCRVGRYKSRNVSGLEIAPGGRHLYALQANSDGRRGTGVVQLMKRR